MTKDNSTILSGIVENINTVIIDYQLSLQHDVYNQILRLIVSSLVLFFATEVNIYYVTEGYR